MSLHSFAVDTPWRCGRCHEELEPGKVTVEYLGNEFTVELMRCTQCRLVLIPEELALGKMYEVEQLLEDK